MWSLTGSFLLFRASIRSRLPGPTLDPGVLAGTKSCTVLMYANHMVCIVITHDDNDDGSVH